MKFFVCLDARYVERPTEMHIAAVKRILRYLKGALSFGIMYRCKPDGDLMMQGCNDYDYVGDHDDRKSPSGYVFTMRVSAVFGPPRSKQLSLLHH